MPFFAPPKPPTLTMLMQSGCEACAATKPEFEKLGQIRGLRLATIDLADANGKVPFPVEAVPAFHLQFSDCAFYVDAKAFAEKAGVAPDEESLTKWLRACVARRNKMHGVRS